MSTWGQLVDRALLELGGYTEDQESVTALAGPVSDTATTLPVLAAEGLSRGLVEVGGELVWVGGVDAATGALTGCVRGWRGSVAVAHSAGAEVRDNPRFPRHAVEAALADVVRAVFPRLWALRQTAFDTDLSIGYEMPADCERVLRVEQQDLSGLGYWSAVKAWGFDSFADVDDFPSGRCLRVDVPPGRRVRAVYAGRPAVGLLAGDEFTVSGLPASAEDVVLFGACARLVSGAAAGQQSGVAAEAQLIDARQLTAGGLQVARYYYALYQSRLEEEAAALQAAHQVRAHRRF